MRKRNKKTAVLSVAAALVCSVTLALPAFASSPGENGKIAFSSDRDGDHEIYTMAPNGRDQSALTSNNGVQDDHPSWSPDGERVAYDRVGPHVENVWHARADGTDKAQVTSGGLHREPAWSPDGTKLALISEECRYCEDGSTSQVGWVYADGTPGDAPWHDDSYKPGHDTPAWSSTGKIAYFVGGSTDVGIFTMDADGTNRTEVSEDGWFPDWSPDGSKIVYEAYVNGSSEIFVMNADGTNVTRLTSNAAGDSDAVFSPDGKQIAFTSYRDGNGEIYVMNADGSGQTNITRNPAFDRSPAWGPASAVQQATPTPQPDATVRLPPSPFTQNPQPARNAAPVISDLRPADRSGTRSRMPVVTAIVTDDKPSWNIDGKVTVYLDGKRARPSRVLYDPSDGHLTFYPGKLSYGQHTVRVAATDAEGLRSARVTRFSIKRR